MPIWYRMYMPTNASPDSALKAVRKVVEQDKVPPVIGPWLIKKKMEQELSVMITRLERHAGAARGLMEGAGRHASHRVGHAE